jgi:preprotein translocase subunit SecG
VHENAPPTQGRRPLSEQGDDEGTADILGRATMAIGVVVIIGAIALSVWAAGG